MDEHAHEFDFWGSWTARCCSRARHRTTSDRNAWCGSGSPGSRARTAPWCVSTGRRRRRHLGDGVRRPLSAHPGRARRRV